MKMTKGLSISIGSIILICIIGLILWLLSDLYFARKIALFQETSDWTRWGERIPPGENIDHLRSNDPTIPIEIRPSVFLRTDASSGLLLLKHKYGTVVYMFDPATQKISEISEDEWEKSTGEITQCREQLPGDYNQKVQFTTYPDYAATLSSKKIHTYGRYVLFATESPTRSKVALLSAAGPRSGPGISIIFGLGGSDPEVKGQKYVQIMDLNSGIVGEPVRISGTGESDRYRFCWTADEKYLVNYKPYENFSIIETNKTAQ